MTRDQWQGWLTQWFKTHKVVQPPEAGDSYTQEVMSRIRQPEKAPAFRPRWFLEPAPRFAFASALAACLAVVVSINHLPGRGKNQLQPQTAQTLVVAQAGSSASSEESWDEETTQLWFELEESGETPALSEAGSAASEKEWLDQLKQLDEMELAVS